MTKQEKHKEAQKKYEQKRVESTDREKQLKQKRDRQKQYSNKRHKDVIIHTKDKIQKQQQMTEKCSSQSTQSMELAKNMARIWKKTYRYSIEV